MCELKSKTDRGSSSMSEIVAKRVGLFSSGEKKNNQIRLTNISPRHLDQGDQGLLQTSQAAWPWMASHVLSIMQPTDSSSTAEFGSMKGWSTTGHFFYNSASIDFPYATETNSSLHHRHVIMNTQKVRENFQDTSKMIWAVTAVIKASVRRWKCLMSFACQTLLAGQHARAGGRELIHAWFV